MLAPPRPGSPEPATLPDLRLIAVLLIVGGALAALAGLLLRPPPREPDQLRDPVRVAPLAVG